MINEAELNAIKGLVHYLNYSDGSESDLAFDVSIIDPNGETLARIERQAAQDYQLLFGDGR
jgi:hypothetical protein